MDAGVAALLGATIGFLSGPISAWVADYLRFHRTDKANAIRRTRLHEILVQPKRTFYEIEDLANIIGADEALTKSLLVEIGARPSLARASTKWALISRVPTPDDASSETEEHTG